jgi:hypothetical protein
MRRSHAVLLVLVSVALSHALTPAVAWAQAKAQTALAGVSVTTGNGLSGVGSADDPIVLAAAGASSAGAVTTGTQTIAGAKTLSSNLTVSSGTIFGTTSNSKVVMDNAVATCIAYGAIQWCCNSARCYALQETLISVASGDALIISGGAYLRNNKSFAGAPTAGDCDEAAELGRTAIDTTNHRFYWCEGTTGWKYAAGT